MRKEVGDVGHRVRCRLDAALLCPMKGMDNPEGVRDGGTRPTAARTTPID
jgi:hypothetical protein